MNLKKEISLHSIFVFVLFLLLRVEIATQHTQCKNRSNWIWHSCQNMFDFETCLHFFNAFLKKCDVFNQFHVRFKDINSLYVFDHHLIQVAKLLIETFEFIFEHLLCSIVKICFTIIEFHVESTLTWKTKELTWKMKNENENQSSNLNCEKINQTMKKEKKFNDLKFNDKNNMSRRD